MNWLSSLLTACTKHSTRHAFCIGGRYYTYAQLAERIAATQQLLKHSVCADGTFIGIIDNNDFDTYGSLLGVLLSGRAYVPISPSNPLERSMEVVRHAGIKTLLASKGDALTSHLDQSHSDIELVRTDTLEPDGLSIEPPELEGGEAAYMLFTSGSTGVPKGVPISFRNIDTFIDAFGALGYNIDENDRFLQMFDLTFDLSIMSYLVPLTLGSCVYPVPANEIKYLAVYQLLEEQDLTFALMVPSILSYLRPHLKDIRLNRLRYSLFCGEALYDDVVREWSTCIPNARIQNVYGPTEATIFCLAYEWTRTQRTGKSVNDIVPLGQPMKHTQAIVVDSTMVPVKRGEQGELCLAGDQLTAGYWSNRERSEKAFFTHGANGDARVYYRTGDSAYIDSDGDFIFCGRIDDQVKVQGFRVELREIEHHARQFDAGRNVAAVAYETQPGITSIHLFVEGEGKHTGGIIDFLRTRLPYYMVPSSLTSIERLPLNSNGKTDRQRLLQVLNGS